MQLTHAVRACVRACLPACLPALRACAALVPRLCRARVRASRWWTDLVVVQHVHLQLDGLKPLEDAVARRPHHPGRHPLAPDVDLHLRPGVRHARVNAHAYTRACTRHASVQRLAGAGTARHSQRLARRGRARLSVRKAAAPFQEEGGVGECARARACGCVRALCARLDSGVDAEGIHG